MDEKKKKSKFYSIFIIILLVASSALIAFVIISPYVVLYKNYQKSAMKRVADGGEEVFKNAQSSIVYDKDDKEIAVFRSSTDKYYLNLNDISDVTKYAFVELVDRKFFDSTYADYKILIPIVKDELKAKNTVKNVSPITRRMARELFLSYDVDRDNYVTEVFVANELQKAYTKDQIFEYYINNAYFNNGYYGLEAAARGYFDTDATKLTTSKLAFLAAIAEDPSKDPLYDMDDLLVKRNVIVTRLLSDGIIDNAEYYRAISEEITFAHSEEKKYNYLESYVVNCVVTELMQKDGFIFRDTFESDAVKNTYESEYDKCYHQWFRALYTEGYRIHTSLDTAVYEELQRYVDNTLAYNTEVTPEGNNRMEGAIVCIDNSTGNVVALVGGRSVHSDSYAYNRAFEQYNVTGNVITPLNVYTPFIEWHHNPDYIVYEAQAVDGTLINKVTLREAILNWENAFATKVYGEITPKYALSLLSHMDFRRAVYAPREAGSYGYVSATLSELAAGYGTLANDGTYRKLTCIEKVDNTYGQNVYTRSNTEKNVYAANDSRIMTEILAYNMSDGYLKAIAPDNAITAGLNSVVNRGSEATMAGYSKYYTVAVWTGYIGLDNIDESKLASETLTNTNTLWKTSMEYLHKGLDLEEFENSGPYSDETEAFEESTQPTTEQPSLGGRGGHPGDGDDYLR